MDEREVSEVLLRYWTSIYQQHDVSSLHNIWNENTKQSYKNELEEVQPDRVNLNDFTPMDQNLSEWVGNLFTRISYGVGAESGEGRNSNGSQGGPNIREGWLGGIEKMDGIKFTEGEVTSHMGRMKGGKQAGLDGIRPEIYEWLCGSVKCVKLITKCMNDVLVNGNVPEHWKQTKTLLIPKKAKPNFSELRPITLNDTSYKLFMSLSKEKLFTHMKVQNCISELQAGFTGGKRIEDNLLVLRYCISESRRLKKPLFITAIDFMKAFDSIDRQSILRAVSYTHLTLPTKRIV